MTRYVSDDAGQFVAIPHDFWDCGWSERLSSSAIVVYIYLKFRAGSTNDAYPSLATIAASCGMSKSTVVRAIGELEAMCLISVSRMKSTANESEVNHYRILNLKQGVVQKTDDPSYKFHTTRSTKSGQKQDTSEQDTSEQDTSIAAAPKSDRRRERKQDPLFNAIAEAWKGEPYHTGLLTNGQSSLVGKATAELRAIGAAPEQVPREWASLRERFVNPTPAALAKHWGTNGTGPKRATDPIDEIKDPFMRALLRSERESQDEPDYIDAQARRVEGRPAQPPELRPGVDADG